MTAQFSDVVCYNDLEYTLAEISGEGMFVPHQHGLRPISRCTACWNGYLCFYSVAGGMLRLQKLLIWLADDHGKIVDSIDKCPTLFGVPPRMRNKQDMFDWSYEPGDAVVPFTGRLLLARDFIKELYVHMGFHPAWKYREIHELNLEKGRLVSATDKSSEMAVMRERMKDPPEHGGVSG